MGSSRTPPMSTCSLWNRWILLSLCLASYQELTAAYSVLALHSKYICPEGQNVNLTCTLRGHHVHQHDQLTVHWTFNKDRNPDCSEKGLQQNTTENKHHKPHKPIHFTNGVFYRTLSNITQQDSGSYCCFLYETNKKHLIHEAHSYIELQVKTDDPNLKTCSLLSSDKDKDNDGTTAAALAIVACIVGILCMPLILVLVYKQRKAVTRRRAQELVRMDSDAQGLENPVFDDPPVGIVEQRPRLIFMSSRQQSDSGRHLLSEPNTPLSPPGPNDCFFPSLEPVPDSPDHV
ncbi:V-type immunoglobulin domain-containing suppressor of T-cell activation [Gastrophryne carolinensis]